MSCKRNTLNYPTKYVDFPFYEVLRVVGFVWATYWEIKVNGYFKHNFYLIGQILNISCTSYSRTQKLLFFPYAVNKFLSQEKEKKRNGCLRCWNYQEGAPLEYGTTNKPRFGSPLGAILEFGRCCQSVVCRRLAAPTSPFCTFSLCQNSAVRAHDAFSALCRSLEEVGGEARCWGNFNFTRVTRLDGQDS